MSMSKAEEMRGAMLAAAGVHPSTSKEKARHVVGILDDLIRAVRDEEWGRAVAAGLVEDTACPRCSTEACSVCPANKTRYCP